MEKVYKVYVYDASAPDGEAGPSRSGEVYTYDATATDGEAGPSRSRDNVGSEEEEALERLRSTCRSFGVKVPRTCLEALIQARTLVHTAANDTTSEDTRENILIPWYTSVDFEGSRVKRARAQRSQRVRAQRARALKRARDLQRVGEK